MLLFFFTLLLLLLLLNFQIKFSKQLQIEEYAEKFQLYQKSLGDSNQAFSKFKDDMQKVGWC